MLYRLLRNNKESGPYTALELKDLGLKPYDLLWTEGRGAAWKYASEIAELKAFAPVVEEQPFDRFFKKDGLQEAVQQPAATEKKIKPRFRISGDKIIMVEAGNMEVSTKGIIKETVQVRLPKETPVAAETSAAQNWQQTYAEWQPQTQKKEAIKEKPVEVETKYSESLDDLKKRYAEKVLNEKSEKPSSLSSVSVKQNIMAAVALVVLAIGGYIGYTVKQKNAASTEGKPAIERADIAGDNALSSQSSDDNNAAKNNQKGQANTQPVTNPDNTTGQIKTAKPSIEKPAVISVVNNANNNQPPVISSPKNAAGTIAKTNLSTTKLVDKTAALTDKKKDGINTNNSNAVVSKPVVQPNLSAAKTTGGGNTVPAPVETKPIAKQNAPKKIDDYISVKKLGGSATGVQNVRLLVNNVTDFPIDLAVIDIQYFDSKGKYQKGETMYVKNIDGGNNVEVRVPDSDKSSSIKYKVSLVSSEKKTLYLVAD